MKQRRHPCCRPGYRGELCEALEALLLNPGLHDKSGYLNSDGRRLLERLLRMLVEEHPEHRRLAARLRREPSLDEVARTAELSFYRCSARELVQAARGLLGPYIYRAPLFTPGSSPVHGRENGGGAAEDRPGIRGQPPHGAHICAHGEPAGGELRRDG